MSVQALITSNQSPIPLYHRVFGVLRQRVLDGTYGVGDRIAPEDELAAEFNVSRATIRQAVGELVRSGIVSRQQGRGTFVLPRENHAAGQTFSGSLSDLIAESKRARIASIDLTANTDLPPWIAQRLGLEEPSGTVVQRVRTMDGEPFAFTINYLPSWSGRLLSRKQLQHTGLMQLLESKGVRIASATQSIRAQMSDVKVSENLQVDLGSPVLFVERLLLDPDGRPIEFVQSWYRGDLYEYTVSLSSTDDASDLQLRFA
jgi:GntR family transcriptional regulator